MRKASVNWLTNARHARTIWGPLPTSASERLKELTVRFSLSVARGDLLLVDGKWYISHSGLLHISHRCRCSGIKTVIREKLSDPASSRWVFKATVYKNRNSKGFVGYGDADPSNVAPMVRGAEMRVAETRAVNRALRKAYGIGLCSVEEVGWAPRVADAKPSGPSVSRPLANNAHGNGRHNGQPRLRDRLCLLIRQHRLDAGLVKAYAADYCGTPTLRDASREQVEAFVNHLAERAAKDREGLICQLNGYAQQPGMNS